MTKKRSTQPTEKQKEVFEKVTAYMKDNNVSETKALKALNFNAATFKMAKFRLNAIQDKAERVAQRAAGRVAGTPGRKPRALTEKAVATTRGKGSDQSVTMLTGPADQIAAIMRSIYPRI